MRESLCVISLSVLLLVAAARVPAQAQTSGSLQIYLARHGQTDWNAEHRLQGSTDIPLNDAGRGQAAQLARRLTGIHLDAIYSSALLRSRTTAEIVSGSVAITVLPALNERRLGIFEGQRTDTEDPAAAAYPKRSQDPDDDLGGGESLSAFSARVRAALSQILSRHSSGAILIIGHGGTNQMIAGSLLGLPLAEAASFQQANDDLYLIQLDPGQSPRMWKLVTFDPSR